MEGKAEQFDPPIWMCLKQVQSVPRCNDQTSGECSTGHKQQKESNEL